MTTPSSSFTLAEFCSWAASQGVMSNLIPKESKGKGIGLFVPADLVSTDQDQNQNQNKDDADLLFVPSSLLLSRSKVLTMDCPPLLKTLDLLGSDLVNERLALILFLLYGRLCATQDHQRARSIPEDELIDGQQSKIFWPYIASLPEVSTPVTLEAELVRGYLAGTLLLDSVCAKRAKLEGEFEHLSGNMAAFEHWPVSPTLSDFIWADATFWSRVLSFQSQWEGVDFQDDIPDDMHMVPYLDFANHASTPNIRWQVDKDGLHVVENGLQQREESSKDAPDSHQEVFLSYGSKPNTELLFLYGFLLHDNPTQFLTLAMPMDEEDPYYMPKAHTLMRLGIQPRITLYTDNTDGPEDLVELCDGLWITAQSQLLLRIYALNEEDGLGAMIEEPDFKACVPCKVTDDSEDTEEMSLDGEDTLGRLVMTISGAKVESREDFEAMIPAMEMYPVLVLRGLVLVNNRVEYYVSRIMETGDRVQRVEDVVITRAVSFVSDHDQAAAHDADVATALLAKATIEDNPKPSQPQFEQDRNREELATGEQLMVEAQVSCLVSLMKAYRTEEMSTLVQIGNYLGEAQTKCLDESPFIQEYLARMQHAETE